MESFSNFTNINVKFLREQKNISQAKLSEDLNIDQSTLAKWENNTRQITNKHYLSCILVYFCS